MTNKNIITFAVIAIIVSAASFYGGMTYANSKNSALSSAGNFALGGGQGGGQFQKATVPGGGNGRTGGANFARGGGATSGQVIKKDDKTITVKLNDGSSKIVYFAPSTSITKSVNGETGDLTEGINVMVNGTANSDGSVVAQFIQIRPQMPATGTPENVPGNNPNK